MELYVGSRNEKTRKLYVGIDESYRSDGNTWTAVYAAVLTRDSKLAQTNRGLPFNKSRHGIPRHKDGRLKDLTMNGLDYEGFCFKFKTGDGTFPNRWQTNKALEELITDTLFFLRQRRLIADGKEPNDIKFIIDGETANYPKVREQFPEEEIVYVPHGDQRVSVVNAADALAYKLILMGLALEIEPKNVSNSFNSLMKYHIAVDRNRVKRKNNRDRKRKESFLVIGERAA